MRSSSEIAKEILALQARVKAMVDLAKEEARDVGNRSRRMENLTILR